jgi:hypothetical protein
MSDRDLVTCQWCKAQLRDTYFNLLAHKGRCINKAERIQWEQTQKKTTRFIECEDCFALIHYPNQPHNCPDQPKKSNRDLVTEWDRLQKGYLKQCEFCGECVRNVVRHKTRCLYRDICLLRGVENWD